MESLVTALLIWIGANSALDVEGIIAPEIVMMTPAELTTEFYTGVPHLIPDDGIDERVNALYAATDGPVGTIYIMRPADTPEAEHYEDPTENPIWREILLHELVHHVQWQTGEADGWFCPAMGEREAYRLGGLYLAQLRVPDPMPNRNFWGAMYARC